MLAHELGDTPYTIWTKKIAHQFNEFRTNIDSLLEYHEWQYETRWIDDKWNCFDDLTTILEGDEERECRKIGLWREGEDDLTAWEAFVNDVTFLTNDLTTKLGPLKWSHELALSTGFYAEELSGCAIYQPTVNTDIPPSYFIRQLADFDRHQRIVIYPERFQWADERELVWDLFMDDIDNSNLNLVEYLSPEFDSIGVACNCHTAFEQFCVIELASNIVPHNDSKAHVHTVIPDLYSFFIDPFVHEHYPVVPQLMLRGDPRCEDSRTDGFCGERFEYAYEDFFRPEDEFSTTDQYKLVYELFDQLNLLREDPLGYISKLSS